jgi:tRNA uridine 5-carboxymethylaminomethyl modification enzyme
LEVDEACPEIDVASLETSFKYEGYLKRQEQAVERQRRQEGRQIPGDFCFAGIPGLSREIVERLTTVRPETIGQASRIPGVTPAAIAVIGAYLNRPRTTTTV